MVTPAGSHRSGKRFPVWIPVLLFVLCAAIMLVMFWQPLILTLFPDAALATAITNTAVLISQRLDTSFINNIRQCISNLYHGSMEAAVTANGPLADLTCRLSTASDPAQQRQTSSYSAQMLLGSVGIHTYLDADCAAFSFDLGGLRQPQYFGVTFDSYPQDIAKASFFPFLSEDTLDALNRFVSDLNGIYDSPADQSPAELDASAWPQVLQAALSQLDFTVGQEYMNLQPSLVQCDTLTTEINGCDAAAALLQVMDLMDPELFLASSLTEEAAAEGTPTLREKLLYYRDQTESTLTITAYLHDGLLVALDTAWIFTANNGSLDINDSEKILLRLGGDPITSRLTLAYSTDKDGVHHGSQYTLLTDEALGFYSLGGYHFENGERNEFRISVQYDPETDWLGLTMSQSPEGEQVTVHANGTLLRDGDDISIRLSGLDEFLRLLGLTPEILGVKVDLVNDIALELHFSPTCDIVKPDYEPPDRWSLDSLLAILN